MLVFDVIFDLGTHYNGRAVLKGAEKIPVQILRLFIVAWFFLLRFIFTVDVAIRKVVEIETKHPVIL